MAGRSLVAFVWIVAGCGGDTVQQAKDTVITAVSVAPQAPSLALGTSAQIDATALFADGHRVEVTSVAEWSSSNDAVVLDDADPGTVRGALEGVAAITATLHTADEDFSAVTIVTVTEKELASVEVWPPLPTLSPGGSLQMVAMGTYTDQTMENLTASAAWSSSNTSSVVLDVSAGTVFASAVAEGSAKISARIDALTGSTIVTVTAAATPPRR